MTAKKFLRFPNNFQKFDISVIFEIFRWAPPLYEPLSVRPSICPNFLRNPLYFVRAFVRPPLFVPLFAPPPVRAFVRAFVRPPPVRAFVRYPLARRRRNHCMVELGGVGVPTYRNRVVIFLFFLFWPVGHSFQCIHKISRSDNNLEPLN